MSEAVSVERRLPFFQRTSETSRLAAVSMYERAPTVRERVWEYVHLQGGRGATNEEIGAALGLGSGTVCPRVVELRDEGRLEAAGVRPTRSGRRATVHVAVEL